MTDFVHILWRECTETISVWPREGGFLGNRIFINVLGNVVKFCTV